MNAEFKKQQRLVLIEAHTGPVNFDENWKEVTDVAEAVENAQYLWSHLTKEEKKHNRVYVALVEETVTIDDDGDVVDILSTEFPEIFWDSDELEEKL